MFHITSDNDLFYFMCLGSVTSFMCRKKIITLFQSSFYGVQLFASITQKLSGGSHVCAHHNWLGNNYKIFIIRQHYINTWLRWWLG